MPGNGKADLPEVGLAFVADGELLNLQAGVRRVEIRSWQIIHGLWLAKGIAVAPAPNGREKERAEFRSNTIISTRRSAEA